MPELGFQAASSGVPHSAIRSVDSSPNSVIHLLHRNPSLFSSAASGGLNNSPPMSVSGNHESQTSSNSEAIQDSCGSDSGPKELSALDGRKVDDPKVVEGEDSDVEVEDNNSAIGSCRNSFSSAHLGRWQEKKFRSDRFRQRQVSLDFSNSMVTSPRNGAVRKGGIYSQHSAAFPSPGAPTYRHSSVGLQKGWSSERVPLPYNNSNKRQGSCTMLPYGYGKTLPSKWEDAERWIFSPVSAEGFIKPGVPRLHKQHKSISGPIGAGPPGIAYYSLHSPHFPMPEGGANRMAGTAFSAGVIATDGVGILYSGHDKNHYARRETYITRSASVHGCAADVPDNLDELASGFMDTSTNIVHDAPERNMATQMSPEGSAYSSLRRRPSISTLSVVESQSYQSSKSDIKDVEVDEKVTLTRWSKKHKVPKSRSSTHIVDDWAKKAIVAQSSAWDVAENGKGITRFNREEARITAWENLQKAKAEAAMRRLEMKLEKKRSSSMEKIMNTLRSAQRRAQAMRSSVLANQTQHGTSIKTSLSCKSHQVRSLSGCFTCHAF